MGEFPLDRTLACGCGLDFLFFFLAAFFFQRVCWLFLIRSFGVSSLGHESPFGFDSLIWSATELTLNGISGPTGAMPCRRETAKRAFADTEGPLLVMLSGSG